MRDVAKGQRVADAIAAAHAGARAEVLRLDLGSLASVREFAAAFQAKFDR